MTPARLTVITLGVRDMRRSVQFYEALGLVRKVRATGEEVAFFEAGATVLALWGWDKLAADESLVDPKPVDPAPADARAAPPFRGMSLAWNCESDVEVDEVFARAIAAGAKALRRPEPTDYGGYRGYFADPDGHAWEAVRAPGFAIAEDGRLLLPD